MTARLFEGFARVWTPVALARDLRDRPLGVTIAGTKVVVFRDAKGAPAALVDRCPHRGVALSLGVVKDGCVECPFHGWRLDRDGRVTRVPWNPDAKLDALRGAPLPARELAQQVWVYTDVTDAPPSEPEAHEALVDGSMRVSGRAVTWETHWTRAMENMLDWPHLPFVHKGTIGRGMVARADRGRMDIAYEERPWGARTTITIDGEAQSGALDFRWPNQMNLHLGSPSRPMMITVACVPIDARRTRMMLWFARSSFKSPLFDPLFHWVNLRIANEDRAIVESSDPAIAPEPGAERSVRTDAPTLAFRKRWRAELAESFVEPAARAALSARA